MIQTIAKNYLVASYPNRGISFVEGSGMYLRNKNGEKYLDLGSNYGVSIFGYGRPSITKALTDQLNSLVNLHGSFNNPKRTDAARELVAKCKGKMSRVFFSNSGAEAIEAALKFTRMSTGKQHFIALIDSYHGKTLGALSATSGDKYRHAFEPLVWNFSHLSITDHQLLASSVTENTAALILEPVQGEGGIHVFKEADMQFVQKLCDEKNILLIVDEIQTGAGRTGKFLASEHYGLRPDIICLGKGIAGGIPIGVTLISEEIALKIPMHVHTSTFGGNPLAMAGILAVLSEFEDVSLIKHISAMGDYFLRELKTVKSHKIKEARGIGLMLALELYENATSTLKALQQNHIIAIPAGSNIVRFLPPYLITEKEINLLIKVLKKIFSV